MLTVPTLDNPQLADKALLSVQNNLTSSLTWLSYAFGKCYTVQRNEPRNGRDKLMKIPAIYIGGSTDEYYPVWPDQQLNNHSFFIVEDPYDETTGAQSSVLFKFNAGLIVWCDLDSVYPGHSGRPVENLKNDVIEVLRKKPGNYKFGRIYEQFENVYKEWSIKEIDNQYVMHPFAAIRIEMEFNVKPGCV